MDDTPVVVGFYEWGPWVNGGAWMHTEVGKVDILYRDINQIENTIDEAQLGKYGKTIMNNSHLMDLHQ